jgi:hypothetical protein
MKHSSRRWMVCWNSSFLRLPNPCTVAADGSSSGSPSDSVIPRVARNDRTFVQRRFESDWRLLCWERIWEQDGLRSLQTTATW